MSLIARFVFDKGEPVDVRLKPEQKEGFLEDIRKGNFFRDAEGEGIFYANLEHVRFFYIAMENIATPSDEKQVAEKAPAPEA